MKIVSTLFCVFCLNLIFSQTDNDRALQILKYNNKVKNKSFFISDSIILIEENVYTDFDLKNNEFINEKEIEIYQTANEYSDSLKNNYLLCEEFNFKKNTFFRYLKKTNLERNKFFGKIYFYKIDNNDDALNDCSSIKNQIVYGNSIGEYDLIIALDKKNRKYDIYLLTKDCDILDSFSANNIQYSYFGDEGLFILCDDILYCYNYIDRKLIKEN